LKMFEHPTVYVILSFILSKLYYSSEILCINLKCLMETFIVGYHERLFAIDEELGTSLILFSTTKIMVQIDLYNPLQIDIFASNMFRNIATLYSYIILHYLSLLCLTIVSSYTHFIITVDLGCVLYKITTCCSNNRIMHWGKRFSHPRFNITSISKRG